MLSREADAGGDIRHELPHSHDRHGGRHHWFWRRVYHCADVAWFSVRLVIYSHQRIRITHVCNGFDWHWIACMVDQAISKP